MRFFRPLARFCPAFVTLLAAAALPAPVSAQQILEIDESCLTTYLAGATNVNGVLPLVSQRGVNLDGSLRSAPGLPMAIAGNPSENAWVGQQSQGPLRIDIGAYAPFDVDLALPTTGLPFVFGRTYNPLQSSASDGPNGVGWFNTAMPEIVLYEGEEDPEDDLLYLVYGADRFLEYHRSSVENSTEYKGVNGAAGCFQHAENSSDADTWTLTDQVGNLFVFFGFDGASGVAAGQFWKMTDPAGNTAYVGHATTSATAISSGYDGTCGGIALAYDASDHRFTLAYSTLNGVRRLTQIKAEVKDSGTWGGSPVNVRTAILADYNYYGTSDSNGDVGNLRKVTITTLLNDVENVTQVKKKYYRYYTGSYDPTGTPATNPGHPNTPKLVLDFEGARRFDWAGDTTFDDDFLSASTNDLKSYAAAYMEYDASKRVSSAFFHGQCGCGGGTNGIHEYTYETNGAFDPIASYDEEWKARTIIERPDGGFVTQYFDETSQGLSRVLSDGDPDGEPDTWVTTVIRDADGWVTDIGTPESLDAYDHDDGDITLETATGLIWKYVRESSGDLEGFVLHRKFKQGSSASDVFYDSSQTWTTLSKTIGDVTVKRPLVATSVRYPEQSTGTGSALTTSLSYSDYTGDSQPLTIKKISRTPPAVDGSHNGSGSSDETHEHRTREGNVDYVHQTDGIIVYQAYTDGLLTTRTVDKTVADAAGPDADDDWESSGTPLDKTTTNTLSKLGYAKNSTAPTTTESPILRSRLADQRLVTVEYNDHGSGTYYGPGRLTVYNQAGKVELTGTIAMAGNGLDPNASDETQDDQIDEAQSDPIAAVDTGSTFGTLVGMTTSIYDKTGTELVEQRAHTSRCLDQGAGSEGTHYDATRFGYDSMGRRWRTKESSGTIRRQAFDVRGQTTDSWIGTNDYSFSGGEGSGPDNMVKTEHLVYDGASAGRNGNLTQRTLYVEDSTTDQRITNYLYDMRGRGIVEVPPLAPYTLTKYDNLGRVVAVGNYDDSTYLDIGDDPTSVDTDRLSLSENYYDELGRVWKTVRHKIDPSDGSDDATLLATTWYDAAGRVVKEDGNEMRKTAYDRLGRVTDGYILAVDNDSVYGDADDVSGDIVLEQHQTRYHATSGDVIMRVAISRWTTDISGGETTGALDTNADNDAMKLTISGITPDVKGRPQISAYWYDRLHRQTKHALYGTNGGSDFDRSGTGEPSTSTNDRLLTTTTYNLDGTVATVKNPRDKVTKYVYDALGRRMKEVRNYDAGVNSGGPYGTDDNVTVAYAYANGRRTTLTADLPSGGPADQVTTYTYGTVKGGSAGDSKIATGHLLQKVTYPDSVSSSDVVKFAYNAQSQAVWKKDQAGNVFETDYDTRGRSTQKRVTTLDGSFDAAVLRIGTTYDDLGRTRRVTQYDDPDVGEGAETDEVRYSYDGWGNLTLFEQDHDSAVDGYGSVNDYEVAYTWATATTGRNTIRKTSQTYPSSNVVGFSYSSAGGRHDDEVSRLSELTDGRTIVKYRYHGAGMVVATVYPEPNVESRQQGGSGTSGTLPDLDRFDRPVKSRWTKALLSPVDFYHVELTYDLNSNITSAEDLVHETSHGVTPGFDVKYAMDDFDRLVDADEGTLSGGSITNRTRRQEWTLSHTGNWDEEKLDLDGDGSWSDPDEVDDCRTHNDVNELTHRDTDCDSTDDSDLAYDAAGNITDDGESYKYEWDAFYRLRRVFNQDDELVAEYRYNGLGYRIAELTDTNVDKDVDAGSGDVWFHDVFDERWRQVARYRDTDSDPKEEFVHHEAGYDGRGGSSYIDLIVLRYKDADTDWAEEAGDGRLEECLYYCQNWRADVSAIVSAGGGMKEWVKYAAYGVPYGLPGGDSDSDGDCDTTDGNNVSTWIGTPSYDTRGDVDLDGDLDSADTAAIASSPLAGANGGRYVPSPIVSSSIGYGGSILLAAPLGSASHRTRVTLPSLGRWLSRDMIFEARGVRPYEYCRSLPHALQDPLGLMEITLLGRDLIGCDQCTLRCRWKIELTKQDYKQSTAGIGVLLMTHMIVHDDGPCRKPTIEKQSWWTEVWWVDDNGTVFNDDTGYTDSKAGKHGEYRQTSYTAFYSFSNPETVKVLSHQLSSGPIPLQGGGTGDAGIHVWHQDEHDGFPFPDERGKIRRAWTKFKCCGQSSGSDWSAGLQLPEQSYPPFSSAGATSGPDCYGDCEVAL